MEDNKKKPTLVEGVPTGDTTESGNPNHKKDGQFGSASTDGKSKVVSGKEQCLSLNNKNVDRKGANKICYDAAENMTIKEPKSYEEALEYFKQSCMIEHEKQKEDNSFDDTIVQPYIQEHVIPRLMRSFWKQGHEFQFVYNPYNKHDIAGCDYWVFFKKKDGTMARVALDVKSNLSAMDLKNEGKEKGYKFVLSHYNFNNNEEKPGFFSNNKTTGRYLFTTLYSNRTNGKKLEHTDQIDSGKSLFCSKKGFMNELKLRTDFDGSDVDFIDYLNNSALTLRNFAIKLRNNQNLQGIDKNQFKIIRSKKDNQIRSIIMNLGKNTQFGLKMDINNEGESQTYFNIDDMDDIAETFVEDGIGVVIKEQGGLNKFLKNKVAKK